jgi:DNA-binding winged helix-turn-helix (wHTH) protein/tetratricopeptide (TPR) repeat protein
MSARDPTLFEFDGFRLDRRRRLLTAANGDPVQLTAKAFDALVFFCEHAGEVAERSALMEALWPKTIVEENNLNQVVAVLRRALGDGVIATIKGRGYQFVAEVHVVPIDARVPSGQPAATRAEPGRGSTGGSPYRLPILATIGFVVLVAAFVVVDRLDGPPGTIPGQTVAFDPILRYAEAPTKNERALDFYRSAREYESYNATESALSSATELYARAVEEDPEFALAWARLSIAHIENYMFGLDRTESRRAMSRSAAERALELQSELTEGHMALGWYYFHVNEYEQALEELEIAQQSGGRNAELEWRIGMVFRDMGRWVQALTAFERAVELDAKDVMLRLGPAEAYMMLRDYDRAERYVDQTLEMMPDLAQALNANTIIPLLRDGDVAAAKQAAEQPGPAAPGSLWYWPPQYFGWQAALYDRDYDAALAVLDAWQEDGWHTYQYVPKAAAYAVAHDLAGRSGAARSYFEQARAQVEAELAGGPQQPAFLIALGEALAGLGEREAANDAARRANEVAESVGDRVAAPFPRLDAVLRVFVRTGAVEAALGELERYLAEPGLWSIEGLLPDPRLDPIREDPRFRALVEKHRRR